MNIFYVYALCDPTNDGKYFYIGKGKNNRAYEHLSKHPINYKSENPRKDNKISKIRNMGFEPYVEKIQEGLSETDAYELEESLISKYGRKGYDDNGILTNICAGARPPLGKGWNKLTEEAKIKISLTNIHKNIDKSLSIEDQYDIIRKRFLNRRNHKENGMVPGWKISLLDEIINRRIKEHYNPIIKIHPLKGRKKTQAHKDNLSKSKIEYYKEHPRPKKPKLNLRKNDRLYGITDPAGFYFEYRTKDAKKYCEENNIKFSDLYRFSRSGRVLKGYTFSIITEDDRTPNKDKIYTFQCDLPRPEGRGFGIHYQCVTLIPDTFS